MEKEKEEEEQLYFEPASLKSLRITTLPLSILAPSCPAAILEEERVGCTIDLALAMPFPLSILSATPPSFPSAFPSSALPEPLSFSFGTIATTSLETLQETPISH
ncbi:hypothetical protein AMTR_s00003p00270410 [Amborella trichopoda]|uniref:Uncharacterized protein n=1 Tax=Amborella trichopoda TaxID=13333 RepID=W1P0Z7_AMBTC|nr:hypothetical protein AMTR_s00003p00270410 [Amborella trichopoda]